MSFSVHITRGSRRKRTWAGAEPADFDAVPLGGEYVDAATLPFVSASIASEEDEVWRITTWNVGIMVACGVNPVVAINNSWLIAQGQQPLLLSVPKGNRIAIDVLPPTALG